MSNVRKLDIRQAGRQILMLFGVVAALNLVFFLVFVQPEIREYRTLENDNTPKFKRLSQRRKEVEQHEAFLESVRRAEKDLQSLREEVLSTRDRRLVEVQEELARLCKQFNIDLDSVGFNHQLLLEEGLDRMAMSVPLEGNYDALRRFLQAVETSDKFLLVEKVTLTKAKDGGKLLSLQINMATYFNAPEDLVLKQRDLQGRGRRVRS